MDRAAVSSMNAQMVDRVLGAPADPIPEGGYALRVLRTRGRSSGQVRATPLGVVRRDDALYLVSPQAGRDWVRNLDADPDCEIAAGEESTRHRSAVPAAGDAAGAVATYLRSVQAPWALKAFPVAADASEDEIARHLEEWPPSLRSGDPRSARRRDRIAVRRLDPR